MIVPNPNSRVLVVGDAPAAFDNLSAILGCRRADQESVETRGAVPPGAASSEQADPPRFRLDRATGEEQAVELVGAALGRGDPYAVAFVDTRSREGTGERLETIRRLWEIDHRLQVVACVERVAPACVELARTLGLGDGLLLLRAPFCPAEAWHLAEVLLHKWDLARRAALTDGEVEALAARANEELREQVRRRAEVEAELWHLAYHDPVTGLPNRSRLIERVEQCLERSGRIPGYRFAVLFLDLDNFKLINTRSGMTAGTNCSAMWPSGSGRGCAASTRCRGPRKMSLRGWVATSSSCCWRGSRTCVTARGWRPGCWSCWSARSCWRGVR